MEPIKLTGTQIIDTDRMKQSGRFRVTFELTETDAKRYCGALSIAENSELISDIEINFTEIQGNNNNFEKSVIQESKKGRSVYQIFKDQCVEYSGEDYYRRLKLHLGIEHTKDLEKEHSESMVKDLLEIQRYWVICKMRNQPFRPIISDYTHKDNAYNLWLELFQNFNKPKL